MPATQARLWRMYDAAGVPSVSARAAEAVTDTGWCSANGWSQSGIVATGTNADEAKTSGAITGNEAACAASGLPIASPTVAKTQDIEYPKSRTSNIART